MPEKIPEKSAVKLPAVLTVKQLADTLNQPVTTVIGKLMGFGVLATINEDIDFDTAAIVADDFGVLVEREESNAPAMKQKEMLVKSAKLGVRPPVVTIMGHVDHGKTTLLDTIRKTNVAAKESGGITQHISSYQIEITPKNGGDKRVITFLDTPGHSAFEAMRRHGAQITDLVVLVVAADDGVKPQTLEAINHARSMNVPIMVAINKIDKPDADIDRVKTQLAEHNLVPEDWGGKTITVPVSAAQGTGIEDMLELILLSTDIRDLKANFDVPAVGVVIESNLRPGIGPVATVLIQNGVIKLGDYVTMGEVSGRVRTLTDHRGKRVPEGTPSMPVELSGLSAVPHFGEQLAVFLTEKESKDAARRFLRSQTAKRANQSAGSTLQVTAQKEGQKTILNVVVKADTKGSLEAIRDSLTLMKNEDVEVRLVSDGVGDISEGDITMARTAKALVLGFHVRISAVVKTLADREKVTVSLYSVVYELFDAVRAVLAELMPFETLENQIGRLKILARFRDNRKNVVIGGQVQEGIMQPKQKVKILRGEQTIAEGVIISLRQGHDETKSVKTGSECGMELDLGEGKENVKVGDIVYLYSLEEKKKSLGL
jgi:translation initiation factor IF-2